MRESLQLANVLKLNDAELPLLANLLDLTSTDDELLQTLLDRSGLQLAALTRGPDGATLISAAGDRSALPAQPAKIIDTVGAGDAFTVTENQRFGKPRRRVRLFATRRHTALSN